MSEIYLDAPVLGDAEKQALSDAIDSGFVSTAGPLVRRFEEEFARTVGKSYAVSTQSGTAALHMALYALGIGPGDEVIVPALTFVATVNAVLYVGATPVIVDVEAETWNVDLRKVEAAITRKTKAIIPVHLYGNPVDMVALMRIAKAHGVHVVEDATEALGATINGKWVGTFGDIGVYSFNGNKLITTGGGGMVVAQSESVIERIRFLVNQARDEKQGYFHPELGFNYRMTNLEAALGCVQLQRLGEFLEKKRYFFSRYQDALHAVTGLLFQKEITGAKSAVWLTTISVPAKFSVETVQSQLKDQGIPSRRLFMPISRFPYLKHSARELPLVAEALFDRGLCLPSSAANASETVVDVANQIRKIFA